MQANVLELSEELTRKIAGGEELEFGCVEETSLRATSVVAVRRIVTQLKQQDETSTITDRCVRAIHAWGYLCC